MLLGLRTVTYHVEELAQTTARYTQVIGHGG